MPYLPRTLAAIAALGALVELGACTPAQVPPPPAAHAAPPTEPGVEQEVADTAPAGSVVRGKGGGAVDLATVWASQRVLLVFYMGHWCPHCQKQLGDLQAHAAQFASAGAAIVAVSTDSPDDAAALKDKLALGFDVYSDPELQTSQKWGVADYGANVAKAAVFVIQPGGAITYRKVGGERPTVDELLAAVQPPAPAPPPQSQRHWHRPLMATR